MYDHADFFEDRSRRRRPTVKSGTLDRLQQPNRP